MILISYLWLFLDLYLQRFDKSGRDRKRMMQQQAHPDGGVILIKSDPTAAAAMMMMRPTTAVASPQNVAHAAFTQYPSPTAALADASHTHVMQGMAAAELLQRSKAQRGQGSEAGGS
jgi:hypothetical protein